MIILNTALRRKAYIILLLTLFQFAAFTQEADSLKVATDTIKYQRILLNQVIAYRNPETGKIISQTEYNHRHTGTDTTMHTHTEEDYWDCDRINPFKDVVTPTPFKLVFDQATFTPPVDGKMVITSRFGRRRRGPHRGIDIDLVTGDFVRSVMAGKVRFVGYSRGHGKTVVVRHANDIETVYAHLSAYSVKENDNISEGQIIAFGGNTGNSRGSHLHLEVRYKGICIHPEYVFDFSGSNAIMGKELWVTNGWKSPRLHSSYRKSKVSPLNSEQKAIVFQNKEPKFHKVRRGDTLSQIARSYSLGLSEICRLNTIAKSSILKIGQLIQIR